MCWSIDCSCSQFRRQNYRNLPFPFADHPLENSPGRSHPMPTSCYSQVSPVCFHPSPMAASTALGPATELSPLCSPACFPSSSHSLCQNYHYKEVPKIVREKIYFGLWSQIFQPMVICPHSCGPIMEAEEKQGHGPSDHRARATSKVPPAPNSDMSWGQPLTHCPGVCVCV